MNIYQNRSSIVEVTIKRLWCFFMPHSIVIVSTAYSVTCMGTGTCVMCLEVILQQNRMSNKLPQNGVVGSEEG